MIGMIRPLVKGSMLRAVRALGLFFVGALFSSAMIGVIFGTIGLLVQRALSQRFWWLSLAGLAIVLAAAELGIGGLRTPGFRRQTCSWWWQTMGPTKAWLAWGAHLGLGVATIRVTSIYWLAVAMVIFLAPLATGPFILAMYAAGLVVGLGAGVIANRFLDLQDGGARTLMRSRGVIRVASSALLTTFAVVVIVANV